MYVIAHGKQKFKRHINSGYSQAVMVHSFNLSTQDAVAEAEAEADGSLSLRPAWSIEGVPV